MVALFLLPLVLLMRHKHSFHFLAFAVGLILVAAWTLLAIQNTVDLRVVKSTTTIDAVRFYLNQPLNFFQVLLQTVLDSKLIVFYYISFLGVLGWLDVVFPMSHYIALSVGLLTLFVLSISQGVRSQMKLPNPVLMLAAFSSVLIIMLALLLTWTPIGSHQIQGIQGRYFVLPFLILASSISISAAGLAINDYKGGLVLLGFFIFSFLITVLAVLGKYH